MFGGSSQDSEKAMKQASRHLTSMQAFFNAVQEASVPICVPLTSIVEYKGHSFICSALPMGAKGQAISGLEFLQSDQPFRNPSLHKFEEHLKEISEKLNLAPSTCLGKVICSAAELEGYLGADER